MIDGVTGPGTASQASFAESLTGGKEMGREEFLKLLIAQLQNQDPLKPQDNTAFVAELAQFSSLEQAIGMNDRLDMLAMQQQGVANSQVVSLVGQEATVRGTIVTLKGNGVGAQVSFSLAGASEKTTLTVRNANGDTVRSIDLGDRNSGVSTVNWDGRDTNGNLLPAGSYSVSVTTEDANGNPVGVTQETEGLVESVSFDQGYPVLHLDNGVSVPVSDLIRVKTPTNAT